MNRPEFTDQALKAIDDGIPEDEIFTPILDGKRVVMRVDAARRDQIGRGPGDKGEIVDKLSGLRYRIYGQACGQGNCFCDSRAERIE